MTFSKAVEDVMSQTKLNNVISFSTLFSCLSCPVFYRLPVKKTASVRQVAKSEDNPRWTRIHDDLIAFSHNAYEYDESFLLQSDQRHFWEIIKRQ